MKKIKKKNFDALYGDGNNDIWSFIDIFIVVLIIINVIALFLETFDLPENIRYYMRHIETFSVVIFTLEYILRLWTSDLIRPDVNHFKARVIYFFSFMSLVDLLAILPFFISLMPVYLRVFRILRILRIFRLFKISRYAKSLTRIGDVIKRKAPDLISSFLVVFLIMIIASILMYHIEYGVAENNEFSNAFSALWWAVATFTTIGYGDIYPRTELGKVLATVIAILGIVLVAVPTGIISSGFIESVQDDNKEMKGKMNYCPHCGKKLE